MKSKLAIASFIISLMPVILIILWFISNSLRLGIGDYLFFVAFFVILIVGIVSIIFSIISLIIIARKKLTGTVYAVLGLIIGLLWTVLFVTLAGGLSRSI